MPGAEVTFAGTRRARRGDARAGGGLCVRSLRGAGVSAHAPRSLWPGRWRSTSPRRPPACASCAGAGRTPCSGAAASWPGPMLLAARTLGIPRVLTEADAHLGLANRLAAPLADRVFLAYPLPGREPPRYEVVGRPVLRAYFETTRERGARRARAAAGRVRARGLRRARRRAPHQRRRGCRLRRRRARRRHRRCTSRERATTRRSREARDRASRALPDAGDDRSLLDGARGRGPLREPRGRHGLGARGGRSASPARTLSPCHGRPSARECDALRRRRRRRDRRRRGARRRAPAGTRRRAARRARAPRRRCAPACAASRGPMPPRPSRASCCASPGAARERRDPPARHRRRRHVGHRARAARPRAHRLGLRPLAGGGRGSCAPRASTRASGTIRRTCAPGMEVIISTRGRGVASPSSSPRARRGLRVRHRSEVLADLVASGDGICVAGAHGKTSTTALIAYVLQECGEDPTFLVGGTVPQLGSNARVGTGRFVVAEADESDGSLARLRPRAAVLLNAELDHHDHFASLDDLHALFRAWVAELPREGVLVLHESLDYPTEAELRRYGAGPGEGWRALDVASDGDGTRFVLAAPGREPLPLRLGRARRAQRAQRHRRARAARLGGHQPASVRRRRWPSSAAPRAATTARARSPASASSTTTRTIRPRSPRRSPPRAARPRPGACSPASSRTCRGARAVRRRLRRGPAPGRRRLRVRRLRRARRGRSLESPASSWWRAPCGRIPAFPIAWTPGYADAAEWIVAQRPSRRPRADARARGRSIRCSGSSASGWDERAAGRSRGRSPAGPADDDRHRRRRRATWRARPRRAALADVLAWAAAEGLDVAVIGLGSNLLVADEGYDGVALRLEGELAAIEIDGTQRALRRRRVAGGRRAPRHRGRAHGHRVRLRHPRHRRRCRAHERRRLRQRDPRRARRGRRGLGGGLALGRARGARAELPPLERARRRGRRPGRAPAGARASATRSASACASCSADAARASRARRARSDRCSRTPTRGRAPAR